MEFPTVCIEGVCVVRIPEDALNAANSSQFKREIRDTLEAFDTVVFDLGSIQFLDSSGCGALLSCLRHVSGKSGELRLCSVQKPVMTLFRLVRIDWIIPIYDTREEAVRALPGDRPMQRS
jgi:anti-sigma B factor antagonist